MPPVVRTISVGGGASDACTHEIHIWVTHFGSASLTELNASNGSFVKTIWWGTAQTPFLQTKCTCG